MAGSGSGSCSLKRKRRDEDIDPESVWDIGPLLGSGGFGSVFLATRKKPKLGFPTIVAAKSSWGSKLSELAKESRMLQRFNGCPFVIGYHGECMTMSDGGHGILMLEYADGGTMTDLVKKSRGFGLPESRVKKYSETILKGIKYIHDMGYVHCDIKPDNVLLVSDATGGIEYVPKIADFGLAKRAKLDAGILRGTAMYMSPEAVTNGIQEKPSDIWAFGCTVLTMLTGRHPWDAKLLDLKPLIALGSPVIPSWLSSKARDFVRKCFVRDPAKRSTASDLLNHQFLSMVDEKVERMEASSDNGFDANFIPLGSYSEEEAEQDSKPKMLFHRTRMPAGDSQPNLIFPRACLHPSRPLCQKPSTFALMGA